MTFYVLDPVGEIAVSSNVRPNPLKPGHGRRVGYVFNHHPAAVPVWQALEARIEETWHPTGVIRIDKANVSAPAPSEKLRALAQATDFALVGVGA